MTFDILIQILSFFFIWYVLYGSYHNTTQQNKKKKAKAKQKEKHYITEENKNAWKMNIGNYLIIHNNKEGGAFKGGYEKRRIWSIFLG